MIRRMMYVVIAATVCILFVIIVQHPIARLRTTMEKRDRLTMSDKHRVEMKEVEMDAPEEFERYHRDIRTRDGEEGPTYPVNYKMIEVKKANDAKATSFLKYTGLPWTERGPGNFGGRTRGLIIDPDDPGKNTWFVGSVSGGVWKTTNAGASWTNKTPLLPNLAAVTLAMAASNHNILFAGTGEGFSNIDAVRGDGIWKSTDRGETWSQLSSTRANNDFSYVNRVIVDPSNQNLVLAATNTGIFRSTDGGSTWTAVFSAGGKIQQIVENPLNFNILYATRNSYGVLKSFDRGLTWTTAALGLGAGILRTELAISPVDTARLFLAAETTGAADLYVSDDGGAMWAKATQSSGTPPNWLGSQGWYDNAIVAHPYNRDICFVGGIDIYKIQIVGGLTQTTAGVLGVTESNTSGFMSYVNWGGPYMGGGIGKGKDFYGAVTAPIALQDTEYVSVEIRFGPGLGQKAHRFRYGTGFLYSYLDYVSVPFQAWDLKNNRQLMLSFLDSDSTGTFNLVEYNATNIPREYIFVHALAYNPNTANSNITTTGGERYKNIYAVWPVLPTGGTWNGNNLPTSNIRITYGLFSGRTRTTAELTYGYPPSSFPYVHVDHHVFATIPVNQATQSFRMVNGSDGGIATSGDGGASWTNPNIGYNTSQFYGVDKKPGVSQYIGGTQDNGTWLSPIAPSTTSAWTKVLGGDGFLGVWNYKDAGKVMAGSQYNGLVRSTDEGHSFSSASTDLADVGSSSAPFVTRIEKSNSDTDLLFVLGSSGVWRSDNFGENWTLFRVNSADWGFGNVQQAAISLADPQVVWAGVRMSNSGATGKVHVSTDGGVSFTPTVNYAGTTLGRLSGLATHPTQPNTAYALFSFARAPKILRTTDLGQTWQDISGFGSGSTSTNGFPDVATYCLLVMPHNPTEIWAGTEIGLFISTDNGVSWAYANDAIPAVSIWQLRAVDDEIIAATHGRGIWSAKIPGLLNAPPPVVTLSPRLNKSSQKPDGTLSISISLRSEYDSTRVFVKGINVLTLGPNASVSDSLVPFHVLKAESLTMSITSYKNGRAYLSSPRGLNVTLPQAIRQSYVDNFNTSTTNFSASGFTLQTPSGFTSQAYHTPHPYSNNREYTLALKSPIVVQPTNSFIRFDEVALVEPGEPGVPYGSPDFYDYVVVEATKDGTNWIPLEDGYDAKIALGMVDRFQRRDITIDIAHPQT